ncbi:MAG TPA: hypothetical protein P5086_12395 [Prolixibacteraceae bacterium]|jgi:hypothetical protein|nr:hypothetical protein [Prolixibacteraceae bacterium]HPJ78870.1 hypothetical protein [Prolixibacteraceae bacterium]HRV90100.1 hypothetical protein [Prolixibacteraceae bacterium]
MKSLKILLLLVCCGFVACTVTKPLTSDVTPAEVTDLKLLEPYSYISMIKKGNRGELDDSISAVSKQLNIDALKSFSGKIPLKGEIFLADTAVNHKLEKEYEYLLLTADKNKNITNLRITPTLDKVLESNETRFGLVVVASGFTRVKGNYGKQVMKGAALGLLTMGMYVQTPVKSYSTVYAMIVDAQKDNVTFFRKSYLPDQEPINPNVLTKQYEDIFEKYFWPKE